MLIGRLRRAGGAIRALVLATTTLAIACALGRDARADDAPVSIVVSGAAATGFAATATEGSRPREANDTAALLEGLPGVRVRRLGGDGGFSTLSIRGAASNQVAVVVAGVPLTGAADPSLDLATMPLWPGASVHVYRTFAPAALGGGYLGGVVVVDPIGDPAGARRAAHTEVYDALGSFGAARFRAADVRALGDGWRLAAGISADRATNDFRYLDPTAGPGGEVERTRANDASAQVGAVVQARRDVERWTWLVTALGSDRRDGVAGTLQRPTATTRLLRDRALLALEARHRDDDGRWLMRLWGKRDGARFDDPRGEQGFGAAGSTHDRIDAFGATFGRSQRVTDALALDARLDEELEDATGTRLLGPSPSRRRARLGAALDVTLRPDEAWTLIAAGRADLRRDVAAEGPGSSELLPAGHLGVERALGDLVSLAAHVGALSRAPSFVELLGDGGAIQGAPGLRSERATALDIGLRTRGAAGPVRWEGELVGFASRIRDLIVIAPRGIGTLRAENVGDASLGGLEATLGVTVAPLRAIASYTFLRTRDRTDVAASKDRPLPGRPEHDLTLDVSARLGPVTVRYGLDVVSSTALNPETTLTVPTRVWHGVGVKAEVTRGVTVIGEIQNLFDQRTGDVLYDQGPPARFVRYPYSDFVGYPIPGRRWTVAVRESF